MSVEVNIKNMSDFSKYFPYKEIRPEQQDVLDIILDNWDKKKYFVLQLDVGVGKSGIAKTVANWSKDAYIVTETKQLLDQYLRDFSSPQFVSIKGKANYICNKNPHFNCGNAPCVAKKKGSCWLSCNYYLERQKAANAAQVVMPYAYLFSSTQYDTGWQKRELMVFDECHLLESQLVGLAQFYISLKDLDEKYDVFDDLSNEAFKKMMAPLSIERSSFEPRLSQIQYLVAQQLDKLTNELQHTSESDVSTSKELSNKISELDRLKTHITLYFDSINKNNEWLYNIDADGDLVLTPLNVNNLFKTYCDGWADKFIFMSASILDTKGFVEDLGLDPDEVQVIQRDSSFDASKSPIYFMPCGSMTYKNIDESMPRVCEVISSILKSKPNEKGIIHSNSYKIASTIKESVSSNRLLMKQSDKMSNENLLKIHEASKNSVLLSPSMTTGVDLKDDLSRWQVVVKMPFGNMADERIKVKASRNWGWYVCEMLRTLVQACGRSTRSAEDHSVTYVLDGSFKKWVTQYSKWLPKSFLDRIKGF